jgi:peptidoglycan/LPS O-acetylase OafA/YrhL
MTKSLRIILSHSYFVPYGRLTFGVFLSHSVFMQFKIFNLENGIWAQKMQINLDFFAYLAISFIFSFITYLLIESPFSNLLNDFFRFRKVIS